MNKPKKRNDPPLPLHSEGEIFIPRSVFRTDLLDQEPLTFGRHSGEPFSTQ